MTVENTPEFSRPSGLAESSNLKPSTRTVWPPLQIEEHPIDEYVPIRAVVVGAGISGITAGVLLPAKVPALDLVIYERGSDIGGVWQANTYPGVRCDVPAHAYQATFAPSTSWTEAYAQGPEILNYWREVADKYDVRKYVRLEHKVSSAEWSDDKGKWLIQVSSKYGDFIDEAHFLLTATGHFADPKFPEYPGMDKFQGDIFHTSAWKASFDPKDKNIAVIGNGASGIQVLPQLQKVARKIDHYARNPTWVAAPIGGETLENYVAEGIEKARISPENYLEFRKGLENKLFSRFGSIFKGSDKNATTREGIEKLMASRLVGRPELVKQIVPEFSPSCRRLTPGPGYLEALAADNVAYITEGIAEFTEKGIKTVDGTLREVDAVVCSTGHDITFSSQFPVLCRGKDLQSSWRPGGSPGFPDSYLGMAAPGFPNFLTLVGPNSTGPAGTLCHSVEIQVTYCAKVLRKAVTQGIRSLEPTQAATDDFRAYCESFFPRTVMSEDCSSWYNGGIKGGRIHGIWPGSGGHVAIVRQEPRWEDFKFTYHNAQQNRFGWLGNGWTAKDVLTSGPGDDYGVDLTPWLRPEALNHAVDLRGYHEQWWVH